MDTVTHTLFGATLYAATNKEKMDKPTRRALLFTCIVGSQIPDIDVISQFWDTNGMYQMWHRGLTHSLFLVPVWAALIYLLTCWIWKVRDRKFFYIGMLAVFIHSTSDLFNAWGTGYLEPFSSVRVTFGTIPIIDFVIWLLILLGIIIAKLKRKTRFSHLSKHRIYQGVWLAIILHIMVQSAQGYVIYQQKVDEYEQLTLSAAFIPWYFTVVGKTDDKVELIDTSLWSEPRTREVLQSAVDADLDQLFEHNPSAKTLHAWAPFVVIVDDEERMGVYDPRFYHDGQSFLFEYIDKN